MPFRQHPLWSCRCAFWFCPVSLLVPSPWHPTPHLVHDHTLSPSAEAEAFFQAAPHVPSSSKGRMQRLQLICKVLQRKSTTLEPIHTALRLTLAHKSRDHICFLTSVTPEPKMVQASSPDINIKSQDTFDEQINELDYQRSIAGHM